MTFTIPGWFLWVLIMWMILDLIEKGSRLVLWWLKRRLARALLSPWQDLGRDRED